jgi:glycosyltransferase involved in cell wall biosynthesis
VKASAGAGRTIVFAANSAWNILNFRMNLVRALAAEGLKPVALVPPGDGEAELRQAGLPVHTIPMSADDTSPLSGFMLVVRYIQALRRVRPAAFLGFTPKPNIFGSIAASALKIPVINNVTGLGTAFIHGGVLGTLVPNLYRIALRRSHRVFFHNDEDRSLFLERGAVTKDRALVIPGSGVDLQRFTATPLPAEGDGLTFLFIGRLLREKGVGEFFEAARMVRTQAPAARFQILGSTDDGKRGVPAAEVDRWTVEGVVEYLGTARDVRPFIEAADCVVLPSYREGMPRVLLEAAAMGRPLIGADVPGCRQIVREGETGFLAEARSASGLAQKMLQLIQLEPAAREQMGRRARQVVEAEFSEELVNRAYLKALAPIVPVGGGARGEG